MSDADDQMGGTGGERGPKPGEQKAPPPPKKPSEEDAVEDRDSKESFPASDPPSNY